MTSSTLRKENKQKNNFYDMFSSAISARTAKQTLLKEVFKMYLFTLLQMFDGIYNNIAMIREPKYLFIHLNRMGYPPPEEPDEWL